MLKSKKILFTMTGSIAAFKACVLISELKKMGHEVQVVTSLSLKNFIGDMTLEGLTGKKVLSDTFEPGEAMGHIELVRWADLIITCPITANKLNEFASGIGKDLLSTLFLSYDFEKPWFLVPAMNPKMYQHPITQESINKLKNLGLRFIGPNQGEVACGDYGLGRMSEPNEILEQIREFI